MEEITLFLYALGATIFVGLIPLTTVALPIYLRWLAYENPKTGEQPLLFVTVKEGEARNIEWNRKFHQSIMNHAGKCFAGKLDHSLSKADPEYWEIVDDTEPPKKRGFWWKLFNLSAYDGLYFLGPPFIANIAPYHMTWVEWDFVKDASGRTLPDKGPISHDEPNMTHVMLKTDVYFVRVSAAETRDGVAIDVNALITAAITNPYKSQYGVQDWLEAVTNQAETKIRAYVGTENTMSILTVSAADQEAIAQRQSRVPVAVFLSEESEKELIALLKDSLQRFKEEYGVTIDLVQIQSVAIAGENAAEVKGAIVARFVALADAARVQIAAEAKAFEITTIANAEQDAAQKVFKTISGIPDGPEMYGWEQIAKLNNIQTLVVEKGKKKGGPRVVIPTK